MGNRIGVDISGTLIRVACITYGEDFLSDESVMAYRSTHGPVCPHRVHDHNYVSKEEEIIRAYLDVAPLWGPPRTFCFPWQGRYPGKAFCFMIDSGNVEEAIREAGYCLKGRHQVIEVTGSGAADLQRAVMKCFPIVQNLHFNFHREISCILEALDFLACCVPGSCFRYAKTHRALNSILPDDKDYKAVPLDQRDIDDLYPFLLVNLKAGVSFHLVRGPNESKRVGGSTIGGATFMGLIRLLCPSGVTPLDAFLLAQSGNNASVDMLVGDIYGGDYDAIGLKGTTVASTFGRLQSALTIPKISSVLNNSYTHSNSCTPPASRGRRWNNGLRTRRSFSEASLRLRKAQRPVSSNLSETRSKGCAGQKPGQNIRTVGSPIRASVSAPPFYYSELLSHRRLSHPTLPMSHPGVLPKWTKAYSVVYGDATPLMDNMGLEGPSSPLLRSPYCSDATCCCCGLKRWAYCGNAEAAAAAGIPEDDGYEGNHSFFSSRHDNGGESLMASCNVEQTCREKEFLSFRTRDNPTEADIARSILTMMSFNVAQLAYFNAVMQKCNRIILVGYYLEMPGYLSSIQHCIDFWSGGRCKINFVRLAPSLGALGASLRTRRRASGAYLMDHIADDSVPMPHRTIYSNRTAMNRDR